MDNNRNNWFVVGIVLFIFIFIFGIFFFAFFQATSTFSSMFSEVGNQLGMNLQNPITNINFSYIFSTRNIIILVCMVLLITILVKYNKLVSLKLKAKQSEKNIDVYLKQRFDLIPNLVDTVKAYCKYEEETLTSITEIREKYLQNENVPNRDLKDIANLNDNYTKLFATIEAYPELKANESFLELQEKLSKLESQLQAARRIYNMDVTNYNIYVHSFPSNVVALVFRFKELPLFEIENEEKENIDIAEKI
jgi:LemA protein